MGHELSPKTNFRLRKEAVAWQNLAPEAVLVQLEREEVHVANPTAATIVEVLQAGPATLGELTARITDVFEVDAAQAEADIAEFLRVALDAGILEAQGEPPQK